ncbi:unnamed protein product, partial [Arabidopsis halleri]
MGRGRRHRGTTSKRNQIENSNENVENPLASFDSNNFQKPICSNLHFEDYYKEQRIVKAEEWDSFMEFLHKPLPAAFRVNSNGQFCDEIRLKLENDFMKSLQAERVVNWRLSSLCLGTLRLLLGILIFHARRLEKTRFLRGTFS